MGATAAAPGAGFLAGRLGKLGPEVFRLGLSGTYRPGERVLRQALDEGLNYVFCYGMDRQTIRVLRELGPSAREGIVIATGAYNLIWGHTSLRRTLERRLRQLRTDWIDVFHFLGVMRPRQFPPRVRDELLALREEGRVGRVAVSTHDRRLAGALAAEGALDVLMVRYNAAHRGAETEVFPRRADGLPGIVSYTATRWTKLLRAPRGWPRGRPVPTAGDCYRFVLGNPSVDVCLMAPRNEAELYENLEAVQRGPLAPEEDAWMREFGDAVHARGGWFL
jgi:aryl-alcohol dehydrogenase-like predicted oxidoreductase